MRTSYMYVFACFCLVLGMVGCSSKTEFSEMNSPGSHAGTGVILRVDPPQDGMEADRFVELRHKGDTANSKDKKQLTSDDWITVSLRSGFIKYLREGSSEKRKGEVVVLLTFHSGSTVQDQAFVVYASKQQTLASALNFNEWPVIGPVQVDVDNFLMRVVMLEIDTQENPQLRNALGLAINTAAALNSKAAMVKEVALGVADLIVGLNKDEVILDERFGFRRTFNFDDSKDYINYSPLVEGTYVLVHQEDRLQRGDVVRSALLGTRAPNVERIRFDTKSHRLYGMYNYIPCNEIADNGSCVNDEFSRYLEKLSRGTEEYGLNHFPCKSVFRAKRDLKFDDIVRYYASNDVSKVNVAEHVSGSYMDALRDIYVDTARGVQHNMKTPLNAALGIRSQNVGGRCDMEFPVIVHPYDQTIYVQYPFHTHLVFSIDRVTKGFNKGYHTLYDSYNDYMKTYFQPGIQNSTFNTLAGDIARIDTIKERHQVLFAKIERGMDSGDAVGALKAELDWLKGKGYDENSVFVRTIYGQLNHLDLNYSFASYEDVISFLGNDAVNSNPTVVAIRGLTPDQSNDVSTAMKYFTIVQRLSNSTVQSAALTSLSDKYGHLFVDIGQYEVFVKNMIINSVLSDKTVKALPPLKQAEEFMAAVNRADAFSAKDITSTFGLRLEQLRLNMQVKRANGEPAISPLATLNTLKAWITLEKERLKAEAAKEPDVKPDTE
ncbi:MAG: hypothetical protein ACNI27_15075 [Desulfovibrio sp.]